MIPYSTEFRPGDSRSSTPRSSWRISRFGSRSVSPAWVFLGGWFLYQFFESNYSLVHGNSGGSGIAFFAHAGGFVFGYLVARVLVGTDRIAAQQT